MIFSELYSAYYNAVAKILEAARTTPPDNLTMRRIIGDTAFGESVTTIITSLRDGSWPLLRPDRSTVLHHTPTMPLTTLEKRWLKSIFLDPRMQLFGVPMPPSLAEVPPLFTREDIRIFDQYTDGDPYEDETYIRNFRLLLGAIRLNAPVRLTYLSRRETPHSVRLIPTGFEYSEKDDKFRLLVSGCRYHCFNMARVIEVQLLPAGSAKPREEATPDPLMEVTVEITDTRNTLERMMLAFSHLEKRVERVDDMHYLLRLSYRASDETEMVIRLLSFGPCARVTAPADFVTLIRARLTKQRHLLPQT